MGVSVSTHSKLSDVDTVRVSASAGLDTSRPKSLGATPVTAWLNAAVKVIGMVLTTDDVGPCTDEKMGVGGSYLERQA